MEKCGDDGLLTMLIHAESGEYIQSDYKLHPVKNDPQAIGSAISYARRYALTAILSLNVDDDDANTATHGAATPQQAAKQASQFVSQNGNGTDKPQDADPNGEPKKWLNKGTKVWDATVKKLQEGKTSMATVKLWYLLNKENRIELESFEKKA
jgi:hypothetical protein